MKKRLTRFLIPILFLLGILCWAGFYVHKWEVREPLLEVYFLDISKGSAVFIRTPNGKTVLIGGGGGSDIISRLTDTMPLYRRSIDHLFIRPSEMTGEIMEDKEIYTSGVMDVMNRYSIGEIHRTVSSEIDEWDNRPIEVEWIKEINSIRISFGKTSVLLVNDLTRTAQGTFLKQKLARKQINSNILYLQSATQTRVHPEFFKAVSPKHLVLPKMPTRSKSPSSVSKFDLYSEKNIKTYPLDREGIVRLDSDGVKWSISNLPF